MNITRESTGEHTATIRMEIIPEDYQEAVSKSLKEYQRKANIPGFRPGKVPSGLIRKMYGKAVMGEEINKLLSDHLSRYLTDEKMHILGHPIPNKERTKPARFEEGETFDFYFDIGFAPEIILALNPKMKVKYYTIRVDDKMVDSYLKDTCKRYGTTVHPETAAEEDMISGAITETDSGGNMVEGGFQKNVFLYLEKMAGSPGRDQLMKLKAGETVVLQPEHFFGSPEEAATQLGIAQDKLAGPGLFLSLKIADITHLEPALVDPELFRRVYPDEAIENEQDFRERIRTDVSAGFRGETDKLFFREVREMLIEKADVTLPDEFLKRWLADQEDNTLSPEEMDRQYGSFADSMKWQLLENKLLKDHGIEVTREDIRQYIRTYMLRQANVREQDEEMAKKYETIVDALMQNQEQNQRISDQLFQEKLVALFREQLTLIPAEVTYEEFIRMVAEKNKGDEPHSHDHR